MILGLGPELVDITGMTITYRNIQVRSQELTQPSLRVRDDSKSNNSKVDRELISIAAGSVRGLSPLYTKRRLSPFPARRANFNVHTLQ